MHLLGRAVLLLSLAASSGFSAPEVSACHSNEYCCPDAKHCLAPTVRTCRESADSCQKGETCCPLTKVCVFVGKPCETPCGPSEFCCPDALHCLTPSNPGVIRSANETYGRSRCWPDEVCCPVTQLCVKVGKACTPP